MIRQISRFFARQRASSLGVVALCLATLGMAGCGLLQGDRSDSAVIVTPAEASVRAGDTQQFTAQVNGTASQAETIPVASGSPTPPPRKVDTVDPEMRRPE